MSDPNDSFPFIPSSDSIIIPIFDNAQESPSTVFSNIFSVLFDSFIENDRFNEAVQNSMDSYNEELFRKKEEFVVDLEAQEPDTLVMDKKCFICLELLGDKIYLLPCGHCYHKDCLDDAMAHQHYKCSLCNAEIPKKKNTSREELQNENGHTIINRNLV